MLSGGDFKQVGGEFLFQEGKVTWCHRMRSTRDHAELPIVREQLGMDDTPAPQRKRWSAASIGGCKGAKIILAILWMPVSVSRSEEEGEVGNGIRHRRNAG